MQSVQSLPGPHSRPEGRVSTAACTRTLLLLLTLLRLTPAPGPLRRAWPRILAKSAVTQEGDVRCSTKLVCVCALYTLRLRRFSPSNNTILLSIQTHKTLRAAVASGGRITQRHCQRR